MEHAAESLAGDARQRNRRVLHDGISDGVRVAQSLALNDLERLLAHRCTLQFFNAYLCHGLCVAGGLDPDSGTTSCVVLLRQAGHAGGQGLILSCSDLGTRTPKRLPHAGHSNA